MQKQLHTAHNIHTSCLARTLLLEQKANGDSKKKRKKKMNSTKKKVNFFS